MVKSWEIVNEHYPELEILFHGCGTHVLNLLVKILYNFLPLKILKLKLKAL